MTPFRALAFLVTSAVFISTSPAVSGNAFQDVWGVATDPLKLEKSASELSQSLERTMAQLGALESQANYDLEQRLEQIRSIVHDALNGTRDIVADATKRMLALEAQVNADAIKLIYRAQCAAEVVLMDQLQRSFAQLIANLKRADPSVTILGARVISLDISDVKIDYPDQAYLSTEATVLAALKKSVNDGSKAYEILSAYQNLERAARFTRCYYIDQAAETRWVQKVNELERLSLPWVRVVQPTM
ncbi:hypothetical protein [Bradyrhizobium symbiodeficiens]|uniref:hypothetical protein n=1 Tax=Bradyrhizobium symbiodeficiens TaxID=1404367 RepID=UPI000BA1B3A8|nr:hypothetical protein [Bradyrhizobium symbiodeficiens]